MGTNFYLRKRITDDFRRTLKVNVSAIIDNNSYSHLFSIDNSRMHLCGNLLFISDAEKQKGIQMLVLLQRFQ